MSIIERFRASRLSRSLTMRGGRRSPSSASLTNSVQSRSLDSEASMIVFHSLAEALRQGYQIEEKTSFGYIMRIEVGMAWARALVEVRA